jgi:nucleoside-diphosphate-sugar epimerase
MLQDVDGLSLNVGSGRGRTVNEIASLLCSRLRPDIAPRHAPAHAGELRNSIADISRAERVLGYRPKADLEEQLEDIISWNQQAA